MATLWQQTDSGFVDIPMDHGDSRVVINPPTGRSAKRVRLRVVAFRDSGRPSYALVVDENLDVRVNGSIVVGGIRVLQHQDELIAGSQRLLFSAESVPIVEVYRHDGQHRMLRCPVCRTEIESGQSIVRCPGCLRIHHQIDADGTAPGKPCWTYAEECRFCAHPTSLCGQPSWRPGEEELL